MAQFRNTAQVQDLGDRKRFEVVGTGPTAGAAKTELQTKLAASGALQVNSVSEASQGLVADYPTGTGAGAPARVKIRQGGITSTTKSIPFAYLNKAAADTAADDGSIDKTYGPLVAWATAYTDGAGVNGYSVIGGHFLV